VFGWAAFQWSVLCHLDFTGKKNIRFDDHFDEIQYIFAILLFSLFS